METAVLKDLHNSLEFWVQGWLTPAYELNSIGAKSIKVICEVLEHIQIHEPFVTVEFWVFFIKYSAIFIGIRVFLGHIARMIPAHNAAVIARIGNADLHPEGPCIGFPFSHHPESKLDTMPEMSHHECTYDWINRVITKVLNLE